MNYISTRGKSEAVEVAYAAASLKAPDGGLYVPERMPRKINDDDIICLAWLSHGRRTAYLYGKFMKNVNIALPAMIGDRAFPRKDDVTIELRDGKYYFEMWQKALQSLPFVLEYGKIATEKGSPYIYGYDLDLKGDLPLEKPNDDNWFGLLSQVLCFVSAYCEMALKTHIKIGEWINLEIDCEMVTAAFYAKELGLKIDKIICPKFDEERLPERLLYAVQTPEALQRFKDTFGPANDNKTIIIK